MKLVKKISVVVLVFVLLMMFAFVAPALAETPTITSIKAVQSGTFTSTEKMWITNGDIRQQKGVVNEGTIKLYIPETASTPTYTFELYNVAHSTRDMDEPTPHTFLVNASWRYIVNGEVVGTFEGRIDWNLYSPQIAHGVLQGTGIFEGQTLRFWVQYPPTVWYGTLMQR